MGIEGIENLQEDGATATQDTSAAPPVDINPSQSETPTGPTTSPDVVITNDPGPAPEGDAPVDDDSQTPDNQPGDPGSEDNVVPVNVLNDENA
jgi:hypothetical protein